MKFLILTGLSGAGKSQAIRALEDMGYFCVDNLPPALMPKFADMCLQSRGKIDRAAVVADIRGGQFFNDLFESLIEIEELGNEYEILFLEASNDVLVKRYKESRRNHPLAISGRIVDGIEEERKMLEEVKKRANHIIDTTLLTSRQLKDEIRKVFGNGGNFEGLIINVISFGFKYGVPIDSDLVFDVRFLPNPYYIEDLKHLTGNDDRVKNYVFSFDDTGIFLDKVNDLLKYLIPKYIDEGKTQLVISIGCTGGMHRSVTIANAIGEELKKEGHSVYVSHRDIGLDIRRGTGK